MKYNKSFKNKKRSAYTNKIIGNAPVIKTDEALDYVKKLGYLVFIPMNYSKETFEREVGEKIKKNYLPMILLFVISLTFLISFAHADVYSDCNVYSDNCTTINSVSTTNIINNITDLTNQSLLNITNCLNNGDGIFWNNDAQMFVCIGSALSYDSLAQHLKVTSLDLNGDNIDDVFDITFESGASIVEAGVNDALKLYSPSGVEIDSQLNMHGHSIINVTSITASNICYSNSTNCTIINASYSTHSNLINNISIVQSQINNISSNITNPRNKNGVVYINNSEVQKTSPSFLYNETSKELQLYISDFSNTRGITITDTDTGACFRLGDKDQEGGGETDFKIESCDGTLNLLNYGTQDGSIGFGDPTTYNILFGDRLIVNNGQSEGINYNETIQNTTLTTCQHRYVEGILVFDNCRKT